MSISPIGITSQDDSITTRDECVLTALKSASGMIRSYAVAHDLDHEDLYQDCAERMLSAWDRIPTDAVSKIGYLYGVARTQIRDIATRLGKESLHPISLDLPLYEVDEAKTIAETIPDTTVVQDTTHVDAIIEIVHVVLHECTLEEQEYVVRVHNLNAFTPVAPACKRTNAGKPKKEGVARYTNSMLGSIRRVFHKKPQVLALVQRKTCVL